MPDRVLVAYATKYGSTKEVAEAITAALGEAGVSAELKPAAEVRDLSGYGAVVLGSPLYIGKMRKDASAFLETHQSALQAIPVAVFALGPVSATDERREAAEQLDGVLEKLPWLKPVSKTVFVGKYDPDHLRGLDKLIPKMKATPLYGVPMRDDRDWAAIKAWALTLPGVLG
jgi:menaquinone-dependent protoporphyrinogen oxidase